MKIEVSREKEEARSARQTAIELHLLFMAIDSPDRKLTLGGIFKFIAERFPVYRDNSKKIAE